MTHSYIKDRQAIPFEKCTFDRFPSNNCIVAKYRGEVVVLVTGSDIGVTKTTSKADAISQAMPIFSMAIRVHNQALDMGFNEGRQQTLRTIRASLGF